MSTISSVCKVFMQHKKTKQGLYVPAGFLISIYLSWFLCSSPSLSFLFILCARKISAENLILFDV